MAPPRPIVSFALVLVASATAGCEQLLALAPLLPQAAFCGTPTGAQDLVRLAEGPALFVDAVRVVVAEVGRQAQVVGRGVQGGLSLDGKALEALGPYAWQGDGAYRREAAADRAFTLRLTYGEGVPGKVTGAPLEADLTRLDSYVPDALALLDPAGKRGPLFPLVVASGLTSGKLAFRDEALRLEVGSAVRTELQGFGLRLSLATSPLTASGLLTRLAERRLTFSLKDTALTHPGRGFQLAIKRFDVTVGLDGEAEAGGDYAVEVTNGTLRYVGAVTTTRGGPRLSLRCSEDASTEFAAVAWVNGKPELTWNGGRSPLTVPALAPLRTDAS